MSGLGEAMRSTSVQQRLSPQARGRELARRGKQLYTECGSVSQAAARLLAAYPDIPSLQAYRYAAGLSQDQAAARYNQVTDHHTCLGGTSINAWETWARTKRQGSAPSFSSLVILATAYAKGPAGVAEETLSPADLIAEAYERLAPEDQVALKGFTAAHPGRQQPKAELLPTSDGEPLGSGPASTSGQVGVDFELEVPTIEDGNPRIRPFTLPNPQPGTLLDVTWETFGHGVERLTRQIKNLGRRLDIDVCFGVNEAGLVMATFLASAQFSRCGIGYLRCNKNRDTISLDGNSFYPDFPSQPSILVCDFEVKHADVVGYIVRNLRDRYPGCEIYFAVFGAMTKAQDLAVASFGDLTGAQIMRKADLSAVFVAATMNPPGIEPPLELR